MNTANPPARLRRLNAKTLGLWALLAMLAAFAAFAALREARKATPELQTPTAAHAFTERRPSQSAADERFSQALWNIHADVRTAAVRMTFAGLSYKMGDGDRASVSTKVVPLTEVFRQAESQLLALDGPASMQDTRSRYVGALQLYRQASLEMIKVAQDGNDAHLLKAQEMSERASGILLEVGEQLWPGEIKPN
jgi:hypothetical protein